MNRRASILLPLVAMCLAAGGSPEDQLRVLCALRNMSASVLPGADPCASAALCPPPPWATCALNGLAVLSIDLRDSGLAGPLPDLLPLASLQLLDLSGNTIEGGIPRLPPSLRKCNLASEGLCARGPGSHACLQSCPARVSREAAAVAGHSGMSVVAAVLVVLLAVSLLAAACSTTNNTKKQKKPEPVPLVSPVLSAAIRSQTGSKNPSSSSLLSSSLSLGSQVPPESPKVGQLTEGTEINESEYWSVEPQSISFSDQGENADIGVSVSRVITISSLADSLVRFKVNTPVSNKFAITATPPEGRVKKGCKAEVHVDITLHCTAFIKSNFAVLTAYIDSTGEHRKEFRRISFNVDGKISTRIDFDELVFKQEVGKGAYGAIFRGEFKGNEVAIKQLRVIPGNSTLQEFAHEVDILERVRSPYIITYYGAALVPGKPCMVSEFMPLGSLDTVLLNYTLPKRYKLKALLDIISGMQYLHGQNILHRDLKPQNVLVASLSIAAPVLCKLTDFGTARAVSTEESSLRLTKFVGTPVYMAPEVLDGSTTYDVSADVYSFSVVFYQLWTDKEPYEKAIFNTQYALAEYIVAGNRPVISDTCEQPIRDIIVRCWDSNPENRLPLPTVYTEIEDLLPMFANEKPDSAVAKPKTDKRPSVACGSSSLSRNGMFSLDKNVF